MPQCIKRRDGEKGWVCDRCESIWTDMLHVTGWRPPKCPERAVHYVGFRDDRYWNARRIWGGPAFIHRWWDKRAKREIAPADIVIFADGDWRQEPRRFNAPDITETDHAVL